MATTSRADVLFEEYERNIYRRTDRLFAGLMGFQWIAGIVFAIWVSPLAWAGTNSSIHLHVWAAIIVGGIVSLFPALLGLLRPGHTSTRYTIAVGQMLMSALLIHLTGGRIETHFHVFGSLAFLAFYRDWKVLVPATIVVALDHMLRGFFWPQSVYGVMVISSWRWLEHSAWVIFEDVFLVVSCLRTSASMRETAERTAALEQEIRTRQQAENDARSLASLTSAVGLALTKPSDLAVMVQRCAEATVGYFQGGIARVWILNDNGALLDLRGSADVQGHHDVRTTSVALDSSAVGAIAQSRTSRIASINDIKVLDDPERVRRAGVVAFAGYPLLVDSKLVGVLEVLSPIEFSPSALETMAAVADAIAVGVERKWAEAELARHTEVLQDAHDVQRRNAQQLTALVEQLRDAQKRAETATRAKSDFLASMSHELRTPLNAIILYSELLQEVAEEQGQDVFVSDLQRIQSAGKHLLELINGILDLSKIEAGKMVLSTETFDIRAMINDLLDTVQPLVEKNQNTLTVHCGVEVGIMSADLTKTRQILLNLLSNAGKFTHEGSIAVEVHRRIIDDRASIEFVVTDTGVGMTDEQASKIFDAFTQADVKTTRKYGGTGLGLALVSRFCHLMGGEVFVHSTPGVGSRFTVRLPAEVGAVDPVHAAPAGQETAA